VLAYGAAAFVLLSVDERFDTEDRSFVYTGGPDSARQILATISGAMITFTGLVFSITILVLQLASSQYSPRILRRFFQDRSSQLAMGVFIGTFTFSLIALREIREEGAAGVPGFAVTFAVVSVLIAVAVFVHYINHVARSIQVASIIASVAGETQKAIEARYPEERRDEERTPLDDRPVTQEVPSPRAGALVRIDERQLVKVAREAGVVIEVVPTTGDFVPHGHPVLRVRDGHVDELDDAARVERMIQLDLERTVEQDPAFGLRQLVDIAERALSTGVNDPTTAVQAIDGIHDLLRRLAPRPFPVDERRDDDGDVRLIVHEVTWDEYVELATSEIRLYGSSSLQVHRRLRAMLDDLRSVAQGDRLPSLDRQLDLLDAAASRAFEDEHDRRRAGRTDLQGMGSRPGA
jgi:uncharacterized membrane protein